MNGEAGWNMENKQVGRNEKHDQERSEQMNTAFPTDALTRRRQES